MSPTEELERSKETTNQTVEKYKAYLIKRLNTQNIVFKEAEEMVDFDYYCYVDGKLHHLLEVKCRRHKRGFYADEKMPLRKHTTARWFYTTSGFYLSGIKTIFLVGWVDSVGYIPLYNLPNKVMSMVARYDRGNTRDIYAFYDVSRFRLVD